MDDQNKNLLLAVGLSAAVLLVWTVLFPPQEPVLTETDPANVTAPVTDEAILPPVAGDMAAAPATGDTVAATEQAGSVPIKTARVTGAISLLGGRIDRLTLNDYKDSLDPDAMDVTLLAPVGSDNAYYALYGWAPAGTLGFDDVPGANTIWTLESGTTLGPDQPVTLRWDNGKGLVFRRTIAIDADFMFTITQSVENTTDTALRAQPYGIVARHGEPDVAKLFVVQEGLVTLSDGELTETDYDDMVDFDVVPREQAKAEVTTVTESGWIGFADKNWMTLLIPQTGQAFTAVAKYVDGAQIYQAETRLPTQDLPAGATVTVETRLFAGAKEWAALRAYEDALNIDRFIDVIDWGWFFFLTKPIFWLLHTLNVMIGNMGVAIIALTILIKLILFPLAYKSYASMARMRELQPEMEKIKERAGEDRQKVQQEMMELYKKEKVNPASGCLPLLLQIPIFFSLYKVIANTLELRHAPFIGWIRDLSAPDPSSILNMFGLLPFGVPEADSFLAIISLGVLPILLGVSMWLQQKLNPAPTDETQKMIFAWMPWIFMFMLGTFASGLVIYWIANNVITFIQQYLIMRSHGYEPNVFGNIRESLSFRKSDEE